jgi:hypothetical protein
VNNNWPSDLRISCYKQFSNLVKMTKINAKIEDLEKFERTFERDEILKI